jgi:hypothetical protein
MNELQSLLKDIKIQPVNGPVFTVWAFYLGLGDFERITYDTKSRRVGTCTLYDRMMPMVLKEDLEKV